MTSAFCCAFGPEYDNPWSDNTGGGVSFEIRSFANLLRATLRINGVLSSFRDDPSTRIEHGMVISFSHWAILWLTWWNGKVDRDNSPAQCPHKADRKGGCVWRETVYSSELIVSSNLRSNWRRITCARYEALGAQESGRHLASRRPFFPPPPSRRPIRLGQF